MVVDDESLLRRYLLGELDESEREDVERELMTSNEHFEKLLVAEDELVDDYCAGKLDARQAEAYRHRFLVTPERHHQHRFGAALQKHISAFAAEETKARRTDRGPFMSGWRLSLVAAVVVLFVAGGIWTLRNMEPTPVRLDATGTGVAGATTASFFLPIQSLRSIEPETQPTINVPDGIAVVELQLGLPADASGDYDVALEDAGSGAILAVGTLPAQTLEGERVVVAPVPSELLAPGDYQLIVRGVTGGSTLLETYAFRVNRP